MSKQPWRYREVLARNSLGEPYSNALLYSYETGTTTFKPTYMDMAKTIVNCNPMILDCEGRLSNPVYFDDSNYKLILTTHGGSFIESVPIWTVEDINQHLKGYPND